MSTHLRSLCFLAITVFYCNTLFAQQPNLGCNDKGMRLQAEQIKQDFITQGMIGYKDAMMTMESKQPFPVAVQFEKGKLYQLIFIGSRDAKKITMELYDGQDKKIDERTMKKDQHQNFIVYSFTPEKTDMYLIVLSQSMGSKELCGSFSIMQEADKNAPPKAKPAATTAPASKPATTPRYVPKKK